MIVVPMSFEETGGKAQSRKNWSAEDDAVLARDFRRVPIGRIAEQLGRSTAGVQARLQKFGLIRSRWTDEDNDYLKRHWRIEKEGTAIHLCRTIIACCRQYSKIMNQPAEVDDTPKPDEDIGRKAVIMPPLKPGYGPRLIHRIAA